MSKKSRGRCPEGVGNAGQEGTPKEKLIVETTEVDCNSVGAKRQRKLMTEKTMQGAGGGGENGEEMIGTKLVQCHENQGKGRL